MLMATAAVQIALSFVGTVMLSAGICFPGVQAPLAGITI